MKTSPSSPSVPEAHALAPTAAGQIEIWKKIVDVQQHFNDLELRVRNFALVVTGAFLGLGGYAIKDGGVVNLFGVGVTEAGLVVFSAILPLFAFYFMDRLWYHRLLDGSVKAGIDAEKALQALGYTVDLGSQISKASPFKFWLIGWRVHSKTKMDIFYVMLLVTLVAVGTSLGFGVRPRQTTPVPAGNAVQDPTLRTSRASKPEGLPAGSARIPLLKAQPTQSSPGKPGQPSSGGHD